MENLLLSKNQNRQQYCRFFRKHDVLDGCSICQYKNDGHLANAQLILNLDVFEHAFVIDYGTKRGEYIDAFLKAINWEEVETRI